MIWRAACALGWFAATSFFWLRGIRMNRRLDRVLGMFLLLPGVIGAYLLDSTAYLLNDVGACTIALGALTIVMGRSGRLSSAKLCSYGAFFAVIGLLLALVGP
jgi:hypothetical protein